MLNASSDVPEPLLSRVSSVLFVFPLSGWEPEYGGFTSYIAKGEDEEVRVSLLIASSLF